MKAIRLLALLLAAAAATGCTHNDGDIGPWFGCWAMPEMTVDGQCPDGFDPTATVWEFQSDLVRISLLGSHHDVDAQSWGTWHEDNGHLYLDYTHNGTHDETSEYDAPAWLMIENGTTADLSIIEYGKRRMRLEYTTADGEKIIYTLKKTW